MSSYITWVVLICVLYLSCLLSTLGLDLVFVFTFELFNCKSDLALVVIVFGFHILNTCLGISMLIYVFLNRFVFSFVCFSFLFVA
jgi:hypothetical protein